MRSCLLLCITLLAVYSAQVWAQGLTIQLPPSAAPSPHAGSQAGSQLPDAPDSALLQPADPPEDSTSAGPEDSTTAAQQNVPVAQPVTVEAEKVPVTVEADQQQKNGDLFTLQGHVVIHYKDYVLQADRMTYRSDSGDATADGHVTLNGGRDNEHLTASHGTLNLNDETGKLYDVVGTVGVSSAGHRVMYTSVNPFTIKGALVVKLGPDHYQVYNGSMTSCRIPHPKWLLSAGKLEMSNGKATARNSVFRLHGVPILYLPYVTHPVSTESRQSGLLIPIFGNTDFEGVTGIVIGEQYYWAINRSTDLTVGLEYYSSRGWAQSAAFHYKGRGLDFATARYSALQDRGINLPVNGVETNVKQGGEDFLFSGRHDYTDHTRMAADVEYLSSYIYRQAFTENFNQAVSSNVQSTAYLTHENNGMVSAADFERFESFESTTVGDEIRILHVPNFQFNALEHPLGHKGLLWSFDASADGLKRSEPNFNTNGILLRVDLHPRLAYRLNLHGWFFNPSIGLRNTFYGHSQQTQLNPVFLVPVENTARIDRHDIEGTFEVRAPVLERTFKAPALEKLLHRDLRHAIEPSFTYRYVGGIDNFNNILRFDATDIVSDTNEAEYGLTQRLFARATQLHPCSKNETPATPGEVNCGGQTKEWISWTVAQKYFFNSDFGGAATTGRRQVLSTTLDLTGVAFLTVPRNISPVISRVRVRTTEKTDLEWDLDYDPKAGRIASSNVYVDLHQGNYFAGLSHARLDAPGEFTVNGQTSQISNFNQIRLLLGYGTPSKRGMSIAGNAGYDLNLSRLQYSALQSAYNWDCCGFSFEYRKFQLGPSVPSSSEYRFSFTLAGVGTAGNLRRAERLF